MKFILTIPLILMMFPQHLLSAPSFDCKKSNTRVENIICGDKALSDQDRVLNVVYRKIISSINNVERKTIKNDQIKWLKKRNEETCDRECILNLYYERYYELGRYHDEHIARGDPCEFVLGSTASDKGCSSNQIEDSEVKLEIAFKSYIKRNVNYFIKSGQNNILNIHKKARVDEFNAWKLWRDTFCHQAETNAYGGSGAWLQKAGCILDLNNKRIKFFTEFNPETDNKYWP